MRGHDSNGVVTAARRAARGRAAAADLALSPAGAREEHTMAAPGQPKSGGRLPGSKNKPKPAPLAPDGQDAPPAPEVKFPPYRLARVSDLIPYERNARLHTQESVDALARHIAANQWTNPILVAGKHILAGHRRRLAAIKLGLARVPTIDLSHLSKLERQAYILWDNKSALNATWDDDTLSVELSDLRDGGFDLSFTGFDAGELAAILDEPDTDPDDAPDEDGLDGKVCCPSCGHEFKTVSKAFRLIASRA